VLAKPLSSIDDETSYGTFRIISVEQRHERSGRSVMLIDGESMGETHTKLRKRQFTYAIQGFTDVKVKVGSWILSPRDDLGVILEINEISKKTSRKKTLNRLVLRVRFEDSGSIRLNEIWTLYKERPLTRPMIERWQKRMSDSAIRYFRHVLPGVIDSLFFKPTDSINGAQINQIRQTQDLIFRRAIKIAVAQEKVKLTSTQLVRATQEIIALLDKH
jgi:hypothetical protein